jgi:hypothetical protein
MGRDGTRWDEMGRDETKILAMAKQIQCQPNITAGYGTRHWYYVLACEVEGDELRCGCNYEH